jgi:hypothetical protein
METLSRALLTAQQTGGIEGVKLAPEALALTHTMYAADLVIFGLAEESELKALRTIMEWFGGSCGLKINSDKSMIWFSRRTTQRERNLVLHIFPANEPNDSTTYLGYPMPKGKITSKHYSRMEALTMEKFNGWKVGTLSQAGRLILVKHVLLALPIYYMGARLLPKMVLTRLVAAIRRFFWGKTHQTHYLAYVSWDIICTPKVMGGLDQRHLDVLNMAVLLKAF